MVPLIWTRQVVYYPSNKRPLLLSRRDLETRDPSQLTHEVLTLAVSLYSPTDDL